MDFQCNITGLITRVSLGTDTRMHTHTQRTEREDEGRDRGVGGGCSYKPEHQRSPASQRKLGDRQESALPSQPSEGANTADSLALDPSPSELRGNKRLMLKHYAYVTLLWWV